jgi:hypothetical protein
MSAPIKIYSKTVLERRRLYIDYDCFLAVGEKLTAVQTLTSPVTTPGIVVSSSFPDATQRKLISFVSGGIAGTDYTISFVVTTDGGVTKQDTIGMRVTP